MNIYLEQLNPQQRAAVEYLDGPELVIAGAGSGKTRVLTYKIVHLLANGYEPWRIMALTFTNKAAREMRDRITALSGQETARKLWMGTFHSIFARILRINADRIGFRSNYTIYDATDSRNLVKTIIRDMNLDEKIYKPAAVASAISNAKNALLSPEQYASDRDIMEADRRARRPHTAEIYAAYRNRCHVAEALDFDDLLYYTNILLRDNDDIRRHYQEFFRYILVDEYQDTNFAQHMIVAQLCGDARNLCVVGDDAQSIYSFRGANIRNILNLKRSFPDLKMFKLEQNYRSTENIINAADTLIAKNKEQIPKHVFSENGAGQRIEVVKSFSDFEEAYLVANRIAQIHRQTGDSYEDFAILYRTNAQSRVLEESLRKRNIPYRIYGGTSFYQRKEVKDAVAYFRLAMNPDDDEALKRVINFPARGIGETTMKKLVSAAIASRVSIWAVASDPTIFGVDLNRGTTGKIDRFVEMIRKFNSLVAAREHADVVARQVYQDTGLVGMYISDNTPESISKRENLAELLNGVSEFVSERMEAGEQDDCTMADFMSVVSLATDADTDDPDGNGEKVTLMTIHAAKGLEFGNVFVVGVEEELLPSSMSQGSISEIEEERRLLYVAITRAKRFCMLSYASSRFRNGMTAMASPSRFLSDIDPRYLNFMTGTSLDDSTPKAAWLTRPQMPARHREPSSGFSVPKTPDPTVPGSFTAAPRHDRPAPLQRNAATSSSDSDFRLHHVSELRVGQTVEHQRFGRGRIIEIDADNPSGERIKVNFNNVDVKLLLLRFARFTISE